MPIPPPQREQVEVALKASDKSKFAEDKPSDKSSIAGLQEILGRKGIL